MAFTCHQREPVAQFVSWTLFWCQWQQNLVLLLTIKNINNTFWINKIKIALKKQTQKEPNMDYTMIKDTVCIPNESMAQRAKFHIFTHFHILAWKNLMTIFIKAHVCGLCFGLITTFSYLKCFSLALVIWTNITEDMQCNVVL